MNAEYSFSSIKSGNHQSMSQPVPNNSLKEEYGFWILITVHRVAGVSFFGAHLPHHRVSLLGQCWLVTWNLMVLVFSYYTFRISAVDDQMHSHRKWFGGSNVSSVSSNHTRSFILDNTLIDSSLYSSPSVPLITYLRYCALAIYHLFSYGLNLYLGLIARPLIGLIEAELLPRLKPDLEHRIGVTVTVAEFGLIGGLVSVYLALIYLKIGHLPLFRSVEVVLNMFSLFAPIGLLAYLNLSLAHMITGLDQWSGFGCRSEPTSKFTLSEYIDRLLHMGSVMKQAVDLLGPAIAVLIANSMIVTICTVCLLLTDWPVTYPYTVFGLLVYSLVLVILVLVASYPYEVARATSDHFRTGLARLLCTQSTNSNYSHSGSNNNNNNNHSYNGSMVDTTLTEDRQLICAQLSVLSTLEEKVRVCPLNLFYFTRSYIITFLAFALSYSVILIQTSGSTEMNPTIANCSC